MWFDFQFWATLALNTLVHALSYVNESLQPGGVPRLRLFKLGVNDKLFPNERGRGKGWGKGRKTPRTGMKY